MNTNEKATVKLSVETLHDDLFHPVLDINGRQFNFAIGSKTEKQAYWFCEQMRFALEDAGCVVELK